MQLKPRYKYPAFTKAPLPRYFIQEEMKRLFSVITTVLRQEVFAKLEHHPKVVRIRRMSALGWYSSRSLIRCALRGLQLIFFLVCDRL